MIVAGIVAAHGLSGLLMVTMMAGVILMVLALTGLGQAVKFIPRPVVLGFTNGIALLIASTQIKDFLGLRMAEVPREFFARMRALAAHIDTINPGALLLAVAVAGADPAGAAVVPRVPGSVVALAVGDGRGRRVRPAGRDHRIDASAASRAACRRFAVPELRTDLILPLLPSALTVALLSAVESLLSAVVADTMIDDRHNSHAELLAQGMANVVVPMVGGIPVTGAIARTATNVRSGARTPVSALVHAGVLLLIVLVAAPLAAYIPLATLAAVLFVVAWNMGEWGEIGGMLRLDLADKTVWAITFALTVMADLTIAVQVGVALAALLYIYRVSDTTSVTRVTSEYIEESRPHVLQDKDVPPYVDILRIHGPFLFGTADKLADATRTCRRSHPSSCCGCAT